MSTFITQFFVSLVINAIFVFLWRARYERYAQFGNSWTYLLFGFAFVSVSEISNFVVRYSAFKGVLTDEAIKPFIATCHTVTGIGLVVVAIGLKQWLTAAQVLYVQTENAREQNSRLSERLTRDDAFLSTIPAALYSIEDNEPGIRSDVVFANNKIEELLGYKLASYRSNPSLFHAQMHEEDLCRFEKELSASRELDNVTFEHRFRHKDGEYRWIRRHQKRIRRKDGGASEWHCCAFDVTDLKKAEGRLLNFLDAAPDALIAIQDDGQMVMANTPAISLLGYDESELIGNSIERVLPRDASQSDLVHPLDFFSEGLSDLARGELDLFALRQDGTRFPAEVRMSPLETEGVPMAICCIRDVSQRKETEAQLRQAQKMQTVGQLTGGIAHDFNNMLTVVIGNLQLVERQVAENPVLRQPVQASMDASIRAAELVKRLLAFSRQQILTPKTTDIAELIKDVDPLLRRTVKGSVCLQVELAPDLWPATIDQSQLENSLLNLVVNASDAMSSGGNITIKATNTSLEQSLQAINAAASPGDYVRISVSDDGVGIAEKDLPHVFEPFFTTKETGKGSGLGLSMVYGFVKQSNGHIDVRSERGSGTTVDILIPRAKAVDQVESQDTPQEAEIPGGDETVLLVEDDRAVREIAVNQMESLGYKVLQAESGVSALKALSRHRDIDLLFTDIVMPGGMTGLELAHQARKKHPHLKVLYTSGYTDMADPDNHEFQKQCELLHKPYRHEELAQTVRKALD